MATIKKILSVLQKDHCSRAKGTFAFFFVARALLLESPEVA